MGHIAFGTIGEIITLQEKADQKREQVLFKIKNLSESHES